MPPSEERIAAVRREFDTLIRPLDFHVKTQRMDHFDLTWFALDGEAQRLADRYSTVELVYSLWAYLDDTNREAEAAVVLLAKTGKKMMYPALTFRNATRPGNWSQFRTGYLDYCRIACRQVLGEPEYWYPHKVLFDFKTGRDYRVEAGDSISRGEYRDALMGPECLAQLGSDALPFFLARLADATPEECSVEVGGGALPVLAVRYFYLLRLTEQTSVQSILDYKRAHRELTQRQALALDTVLEAVRSKKYRPFYMARSDWAAKPPTNAVLHGQAR
jgi:hypothetical protein